MPDLTDDQHIQQLKLALEKNDFEVRRGVLKMQAEMIRQRLSVAIEQAKLDQGMADAYKNIQGFQKHEFPEFFVKQVNASLEAGRLEDYAKVVETLRPFGDDALRAEGRTLTIPSAAFRDMAYMRATLGMTYANYLQLRSTFFELAKQGPVKDKKELISFYFAIQQYFTNSIINLGRTGNVTYGVQLGGDLAPLADMINIIYGFAEGKIASGTNMYMAGLAVYNDFVKLVQAPAYNKLKEIGGIMIPIQVQEEPTGRIAGITLFGKNIGIGGGALVQNRPGDLAAFELLFNQKLAIGAKTQVNLDAWIAKLQIGVDLKHRLRGILPNLVLNASLFGDHVYVLKTDMGYYAYFPVITTVNGEAQMKNVKDVDFYNLEDFGATLNKFLHSMVSPLTEGKFKPQYQKFSGVYVPSLVQLEAFRRGVLSEPNTEYWIEANLKTHLQIIYRHNLGDDSWEIVSKAPMYYSVEEKGKYLTGTNEELSYETEGFLRQINQWPWKTDKEEQLYPQRLMKISGVRDFAKLDQMFDGILNQYGASIDAMGNNVTTFKTLEEVPATLMTARPLPKMTNGAFMLDGNGKLVPGENTRVNPYTVAQDSDAALSDDERGNRREDTLSDQ
jgi:hypothetical protein